MDFGDVVFEGVFDVFCIGIFDEGLEVGFGDEVDVFVVVVKVEVFCYLGCVGGMV